MHAVISSAAASSGITYNSSDKTKKGTVLFMRKWMYKIDKKEIIRRHNVSLEPTESSLCLKFKALWLGGLPMRYA